MRAIRWRRWLAFGSGWWLLSTASQAPARAEEPTLEETVVVYSPHGVDLLGAMEKRFEQAYPNVDVQWLDMGSQEVLDRIRSEKTNPQGDVWWGAPSPMFMNAAEEGLLEPYRPTWADRVPDAYKDPEDRWYGTFKTPEVIVYNRQKVKPEEAPQDWDDLLDPKWKDRIILREPLASGTMRAIFGAMIWRFYPDTQSPEGGYDWLRKLDANTKEYAANPTLMQQKLARGEGLVTVYNLPDTVLQVETKGYPFGYVIPKSGTPVVTDGIALLKGAKHPHAAKAYYEFVTSVESLVSLAPKPHYRMPVRTDIPKDQLPDWITQTEIREMPLDWRVFAEKSDEWMRYWDENIKGRGRPEMAPPRGAEEGTQAEPQEAPRSGAKWIVVALILVVGLAFVGWILKRK